MIKKFFIGLCVSCLPSLGFSNEVSIGQSNGDTIVTVNINEGLPLPTGSTAYIQNRDTLQSGASFFVAVGTISHRLVTYDLRAASGTFISTITVSDLKFSSMNWNNQNLVLQSTPLANGTVKYEDGKLFTGLDAVGSGAGDNLGDHVMTKSLDASDFYITNSSGISVGTATFNSGIVSISTHSTTQSILFIVSTETFKLFEINRSSIFANVDLFLRDGHKLPDIFEEIGVATNTLRLATGTLVGQDNIFTGVLNSVAISTGLIGASTSTIYGILNSIALSTQSIGISTTNLTVRVENIGVSTSSKFNDVLVATNTLRIATGTLESRDFGFDNKINSLILGNTNVVLTEIDSSVSTMTITSNYCFTFTHPHFNSTDTYLHRFSSYPYFGQVAYHGLAKSSNTNYGAYYFWSDTGIDTGAVPTLQYFTSMSTGIDSVDTRYRIGITTLTRDENVFAVSSSAFTTALRSTTTAINAFGVGGNSFAVLRHSSSNIRLEGFQNYLTAIDKMVLIRIDRASNDTTNDNSTCQSSVMGFKICTRRKE